MLSLLPFEWQTQFPQLWLLHQHYRLEDQPLALRAMVEAVHLASLGDLSGDPVLSPLVVHLIRISLASFTEVLTAEEKELLGPIEDLLPYTRHSGENLQSYVQRMVDLCGDSSCSFVTSLASIVTLSLRVEVLLAEGGDDRMALRVETGKVNKYLSSTLPRARRLIRRGSCTCSSVTPEDYLEAETLRASCLQEALRNRRPLDFDALNDQVRRRLLRVVGMDESSCRVVLFPSGSDAELLPLLTGLLRRTSGANVVNIVTAAGEVGR